MLTPTKAMVSRKNEWVTFRQKLVALSLVTAVATLLFVAQPKTRNAASSILTHRALQEVVTPSPVSTKLPTAFPTSAPTCSANLTSSFTTYAIVNVELEVQETVERTNSIIRQLATTFQETYNRINNKQYTPCDQQFRRLTKVKRVNIDENSNSTTPSSFVFRRYLSTSKEMSAQNVRIGSPKSQTSQRNLQNSTEWIDTSLLFEVTVECQGKYCIGDNAELFGKVVINKNGFSQVYAKDVMQATWKTALNVTGSSGLDLLIASERSAPVQVEYVHEIEKEACPPGDQSIQFTKLVIVELVQKFPDEVFTALDDPRFDVIEKAYVSTYNRLIRTEFCDPFFRRLTSAKVVAIGHKSADKSILPIELQVQGECRGCNPNDIDIYAAPSVLIGPTASSTTTRNRRSLVHIDSNGEANIDDKWLAPAEPELFGRYLEQNDSINVCFCDAQPFGNRPPFESEFVSLFRLTVEELQLNDIASVNSCQYGTTFSTGLIVSFSQEEMWNILSKDQQTKHVLEDSLKETLNELLGVNNESCNNDFRVVENVTLVLGTNITRTPSGVLIDGTFLLDPTLQIERSSITSTSNKTSSIAEGDDSSRRVLEEPERKEQSGRFANQTMLEKDRIENAVQPSLVNLSSLLETAGKLNTTSSFANITANTESPTYSPFDPNSFGALAEDDIPVLFFVSGVCSGCDNSIVNGLSNDVLRSLRASTLAPPSSTIVLPTSRQLQEEERAKSDCFCPINATQNSGRLEASVVSESYRETLERENVNVTVEIVDEVDVVECEDVVNEFETTATLSLSGDLSDADVDALATSYQETYNDLNALYCDPLFRQITSIEASAVKTFRKRKLQGRKLDEGCISETEIDFFVRGTCLGCKSGESLYDGSRKRRRLDLKPLFSSYKLSTFYNDGVRRNSRRRLQDSDVCFCEGDTIADRAPSFDEFFSVYEEQILSVPDVCEIFDLEPAIDDDESVDDEYYDDDGQYLVFMPPGEAPVVPPTFYEDDDDGIVADDFDDGLTSYDDVGLSFDDIFSGTDDGSKDDDDFIETADDVVVVDVTGETDDIVAEVDDGTLIDDGVTDDGTGDDFFNLQDDNFEVPTIDDEFFTDDGGFEVPTIDDEFFTDDGGFEVPTIDDEFFTDDGGFEVPTIDDEFFTDDGGFEVPTIDDEFFTDDGGFEVPTIDDDISKIDGTDDVGPDDDFFNDDVGTDDGGFDDGFFNDDGRTDDGGTDDGGSDDGGTDDGFFNDDGGFDDGFFNDDGSTDDGGTDDGGTNVGGTDDGFFNDDGGFDDSFFNDDGSTDDGGTDDGFFNDDGGFDDGFFNDDGSTDDGGTDDGGTDVGGTDDGFFNDDGGFDDGGFDDGFFNDDGSTDDGGTDDGFFNNDGGFDDVGFDDGGFGGFDDVGFDDGGFDDVGFDDGGFGGFDDVGFDNGGFDDDFFRKLETVLAANNTDGVSA